MLKIIKFKLSSILEKKILLFSIIFFFFLMNYNILINSGLLTLGPTNYISDVKYALLMNNFTLFISLFSCLFSIYLGSNFIGKDLENGQIFIILVSIENRTKYYFGCFISCLLLIVSIITLSTCNIMIIGLVLKINLFSADILYCFLHTIANSIVFLSLIFALSIKIGGMQSATIGILGMGLFSLYAYQTIPFVNQSLLISVNIRKTLSLLVPITDVTAPSILESNLTNLSGLLDSYYFFQSPLLYQIIYILVFVFVGVSLFKHHNL